MISQKKKASITQRYSKALIIIQILFSGSFASSQACTGAWLTIQPQIPTLLHHWGPDSNLVDIKDTSCSSFSSQFSGSQLCGWRTMKCYQAQLQYKKALQRFVSPLQEGWWTRVTCRPYWPMFPKESGLLGFLEIFLCFSLQFWSLNTLFKIRWES